MKKRLYKSSTDKKGLWSMWSESLNYFDVDPTVIRLIWVIFTLVVAVD